MKLAVFAIISSLLPACIQTNAQCSIPQDQAVVHQEGEAERMGAVEMDVQETKKKKPKSVTRE